MDRDEKTQSSSSGWRLARRGVELALNNRVDEAQRMLRIEATQPRDQTASARLASLQAQAGLGFLTFMVSSGQIRSRASFYNCERGAFTAIKETNGVRRKKKAKRKKARKRRHYSLRSFFRVLACH